MTPKNLTSSAAAEAISAANRNYIMRPDFNEKLQTYFEGCQRIHNEYMDQCGHERKHPWKMHRLKHWVRIENPGAHSFVDLESGEVLKPAGYARPALTKISRGNIFDEHNGLKNIGPYGVAHADQIRDITRNAD